ncbi:hypothetical protein OEA41_005646 [Lepraria neglecta]|uniref:Uncharacterized protein n=1 Tax=Lepraria neglecta TaxID=209136 RepID=A0AAD9Z690_9LECA|nr:hypothetical protein OEA41_005646 [Lepraria neglecta]
MLMFSAQEQLLVDGKIEKVVRGLADCMEAETSWEESSGAIFRLRKLAGSIQDARESRETVIECGSSWDFVRLKVPIADTALSILTQCLALLRGLSSPTALVTQKLLDLLEGVEFERVMATDVENTIWSCEGDVNALKDYVMQINKPSVGMVGRMSLGRTVENLGYRMLEVWRILGIERPMPQESGEEAKGSMESQETDKLSIHSFMTATKIAQSQQHASHCG